MPSSPPTEAPAAFICECDEVLMRSACAGLPFYGEHEGKRYCVLHYPGKEKSADFNEALKRKLDAEDFNFFGVWFPDNAHFSGIKFTTPAIFLSATFNEEAFFVNAKFNAEAVFISAKFGADVSFVGVTFNAEAQFAGATFNAKTNFGGASFNAKASFDSAIFNGGVFFKSKFGADVSFVEAAFNAWVDLSNTFFNAGADFSSATFNAEAIFDSATFNADVSFKFARFGVTERFSPSTFNAQAVFDFAVFEDHVSFSGDRDSKNFGDKSSLSFQFAKIKKPDYLSFHTLTLRPHWFVNADARGFEFINVDWNWRDISVKHEIKSLDERDALLAHRLLAIACRNLAVNAEENNRYEEASRFRHMAMEARRLERWRGFAFWTLGWWYWLASGYGETVWRAFVVLIGVWLLAAALYTKVGFVRWEPRVSNEQEAKAATRDEGGQPLPWQRALTYSLGVMTLQKPEPHPATNAAQGLVTLETILGPVQAALLALAIRRKFMR